MHYMKIHEFIDNLTEAGKQKVREALNLVFCNNSCYQRDRWHEQEAV